MTSKTLTTDEKTVHVFKRAPIHQVNIGERCLKATGDFIEVGNSGRFVAEIEDPQGGENMAMVTILPNGPVGAIVPHDCINII